MIVAAIFVGLFWATIALIGCSAFGWPYWIAAATGCGASLFSLGAMALCRAANDDDQNRRDDQEGTP